MADDEALRQIIRELATLGAKVDALTSALNASTASHGRLEDRVAKLENAKAWVLGAAAGVGGLASYVAQALKLPGLGH